MKKALLVSLLSIGLIFIGIFTFNYFKEKGEQTISQEQQARELARRKLVVGEWLAAAQKIVDQTGNKGDAFYIVDYLKRGHYIAMPTRSPNDPQSFATVNLEGYQGEYVPFGLTIFLEEDRKISPACEKVYSDESQAASFFPNDIDGDSVFVIKSFLKISETWKGLILIHEGSHALARAARAFEGIKDPMEKRINDELHAYSTELELVSKVGGDKYKALLEKEIDRIKGTYKQDGEIPLPDYEYYNPLLREIFGSEESNMEKGIRGSVFWINAVFKMMDQEYPEDSDKRKMDFFYTAYSNGNMG